MVYTVDKRRWYISYGDILTAGYLKEGQQFETLTEVRFFDNEKAWRYEIDALKISEENIRIQKSESNPIPPIHKPEFRNLEQERIERLKSRR